MTTFQFLHPEFKPLLEPAKGAEQLVHSDFCASYMRARFALKQAAQTSLPIPRASSRFSLPC